MPSEPRLDGVRRILDEHPGDYRTALTTALEEARGTLKSLQAVGNGRTDRIAAELAGLGRGPVDPARFKALLDPEESPDPDRIQRFQEALTVLERAAGQDSTLVEVEVAPGEDLLRAVAEGFARQGRIYGALRVLALLRARTFVARDHGGLMDGLPYREWRSLERDLAPPVVVSVHGSALRSAAGLAEFLDGRQKIVLLVEGPCPPAPLARLIVPGTLVLQTDEVEKLERVAGFQGPAVAALVPDAAAHFLWDPEDQGDRGHLEVTRVPETPPRSWLAGVSPTWQAAELRLLEAWSQAAGEAIGPTEVESVLPGGESSAPTSPAEPDPAQRLASWLLRQADFGDENG